MEMSVSHLETLRLALFICSTMLNGMMTLVEVIVATISNFGVVRTLVGSPFLILCVKSWSLFGAVTLSDTFGIGDYMATHEVWVVVAEVALGSMALFLDLVLLTTLSLLVWFIPQKSTSCQFIRVESVCGWLEQSTNYCFLDVVGSSYATRACENSPFWQEVWSCGWQQWLHQSCSWERLFCVGTNAFEVLAADGFKLFKGLVLFHWLCPQ